MHVLLLFTILFCYQLVGAQQVLVFEKQVNLIPEGIAIDPGNGTIYVSSIAQKKIIRILPDGSATDFISPGKHHFLEGLGLKVDVKRNCLWALSNIRKGNEFTAQIHAFGLSDGGMMHQFSITDSIPRLFNDLVIDSSGALLVTDTYSSTVYRYHPAVKKLEVLVHDTSKLKWPNGIDFLDDQHLVIATYGHGLVRVNIHTKEITLLPGYQEKAIAFGLDGLVVNGNELYGVYNGGAGGSKSNAVVKYALDESKRNIVSEMVIDRGNAAFSDPTTAAKFKNKLYVIANSHLDQFNANKESVTGIEDKLTSLKLVVYSLTADRAP